MKTSTRFFIVYALLLVVVTAALVAVPVFAQDGYPPPTPVPVTTPAGEVSTPDFLSTLAQELALQFGPLLAAALIAWGLKEFGKFWISFKQNKPDVAYALESAAVMAVHAAEQAGAAGYISNKKTYAVDIAQKWLKAKGVSIDLELIMAAIEAAVLTEFNRFKDDESDLDDSNDPDAEQG